MKDRGILHLPRERMISDRRGFDRTVKKRQTKHEIGLPPPKTITARLNCGCGKLFRGYNLSQSA